MVIVTNANQIGHVKLSTDWTVMMMNDPRENLDAAIRQVDETLATIRQLKIMFFKLREEKDEQIRHLNDDLRRWQRWLSAANHKSETANDALVRVRALHYKDEFGYCGWCYGYMGTSSFYPCPTIKVLDGDQA